MGRLFFLARKDSKPSKIARLLDPYFSDVSLF